MPPKRSVWWETQDGKGYWCVMGCALKSSKFTLAFWGWLVGLGKTPEMLWRRLATSWSECPPSGTAPLGGTRDQRLNSSANCQIISSNFGIDFRKFFIFRKFFSVSVEVVDMIFTDDYSNIRQLCQWAEPTQTQPGSWVSVGSIIEELVFHTIELGLVRIKLFEETSS